MEIVQDGNTNYYLNQTESTNLVEEYTEFFPIEFQKKSKVAEYFDYVYNYPPKIKLRCFFLDELNGDLLLQSNYGVLEHSIPFMDFVEDFLFNDTSEESVSANYSRSQYLDGFIDKVNSSNFFLKKTKQVQTALSSIQIFVVLNGQGEIVLSKPANTLSSTLPINYINEKLYDLCGAFDNLVEKKSEVGLFFFNYLDAEKYLKEVARSDFEGTQTVGLSVHSISLDSAYKITREHHPGIDFRFAPDFREVKKLLSNIGNSDIIFDNEQQQLRFRPRNVNLFPYLKKLGAFLSPSCSFLQYDEYFKGVPIYVVQLSNQPRNHLMEQYFNIVGYFDTMYSQCIQNLDYLGGFGHNWIMQGSLREASHSKDFENYIFFEKEQAIKFSKKNSRKVNRYNGSRTSNLEFLVRKPKIYIYNLEDFLEDWEDKIFDNLNEKSINSETLFQSKANYFIPPTETTQEEINDLSYFKKTPLKTFAQFLDVKFRIFKNSAGILFNMI